MMKNCYGSQRECTCRARRIQVRFFTGKDREDPVLQHVQAEDDVVTKTLVTNVVTSETRLIRGNREWMSPSPPTRKS